MEKTTPPFGNIPLYFIPNKGQVNEQAAFYAETSGYTLWMTKKGLVFDSIISGKGSGVKGKEKMQRDVSRFTFINANENPGMTPVEMTTHKVNYLKGNNPSKWKTGIQTSKAILYTGIYKNIDLKVYGMEKKIEYDWIVKPGGDPSTICFQYRNVKGTRIDAEGNLIVTTRFGELTHKRPVSCQYPGKVPVDIRRAERVAVDVQFKEISVNTYCFEVGEYDKQRELVIDPVVLAYSSFLGGSGDEHGFGLAVDAEGCAYVTGDTYSTDFPARLDFDGYEGSFQGGNRDAFVTKFSPDGDLLEYSTYLGGSADDTGGAIQVDGSGKAYITGFTYSTDFPTQNPYQAANNGDSDIFVCRLSPSGSILEYSTYLGGGNGDEGLAIALDGSKNVYVTGRTYSSDFPTHNAYEDTFRGGEMDAFVTKFSSSGASLVYSTYLGGSGRDTGYGIAVNGSSAYVTGRTGSTNFPTHNEIQDTYGGGNYDAFVTKLSSTGNTLVYSTYLGSSGVDSGYGIAVDSAGSAYVTGDSGGTDFPLYNAYQGTYGGGTKDAFVAKLSTTGSGLEYSTYLGGIENDQAAHIVVTGNGSACITGSTRSADFPLARAYQSAYNGEFDVFVSMLTPSGAGLSFSTYLGGGDYDSGRGIAVDGSGDIYTAGYTESVDFPVKSMYQDNRKGNMDAFVAKFSTTEFGTVCGAVDNCDLTWTTGGSGDWFDQTGTSYYDDDALQSGNIGNSQSTYVQTVVTGPGLLSFWWKVSSEWYYDSLNFYIDGVFQTSIAGDVDWTQLTYTIPEGTHGLKWTYEKDSCCINGSDCGWLDKVEFAALPEIGLDRSQLTFGTLVGSTPGNQTFSISNKTDSTLNWTITTDKSWLTCSPTSGTDSGTVTVSADAVGLGSGTYTGTVTVTDASASNSPREVSVTLKVYTSGGSSGPFGNYATPEDGSTIRSSVPFTGWALDDIGVESVKLYRQESGELIYIGDAVFVEGARPDVEQAFPGYPLNYRAGWGYMMLTNFLPNGGNGTFTIVAVAADKEGHRVTLGSKTVTVDNANAVRPFGAIDTPTQGGYASGSDYRNQGWVLTPMPNAIPTDGSTIEVFVDGVKLGNVLYNFYRSDIFTLFPGYANSGGAHGYLDFDTAAYENGLHTIMWVAEDSAGNADGIGSRYFMIQNAQGPTGSTTGARVSTDGGRIDEIPVEYSEPIGVKKGFREDVEPEAVYPDETGAIRVRVRELDKVELHFGQGKQVSGYLMVGKTPRSLPPGSTFDPKTNIFHWQMGPAFAGEYLFTFIETDNYGNSVKRNIFITIVSRYSLEEGLQDPRKF
jgi:hypothetical protein